MSFLKQFWWHIPLFIPGFFFTVFLHELAHAVAVWVQGGTVLEFVWYGDTNRLGHVTYTFPKSIEYNSILISLAPYLGASIIFFIGCLYTILFKNRTLIIASFIFIWFLIIPTMEIACALFPYSLYTTENDLYLAFGEPSRKFIHFSFWFAIGTSILCYYCQKRLFSEVALSKKSYTIAAMVTFTIIASGYV